MSNIFSTSDLPPSYIPECSRRRDFGDVNVNDAQRYDPTSWDYLQTLVPTVIPGVVFGCLALLGCIFFCLWLCVQCCKTPKTKSRQSYEEQHQFVTSASSRSPSWDQEHGNDNINNNVDIDQLAHQQNKQKDIFGGNTGRDPSMSSSRSGSSRRASSKNISPTTAAISKPKRHWSRHPIYLWIMLLISAAVIGVSIWGLIRSINATDNTISGFWDLSDDIEGQAVRARNDVLALDSQLLELVRNLTVIESQIDPLENLASQLNLSPDVQAAIAELPTVLAIVSSARGSVASALSVIENSVLKTIYDLNEDYRDSSLAFQNTWRYIPIAVTFGLTILATFLAALSTYTMKHPKTSSVMVSLLWFDIAVLMLLGAGMMSGVYELSGDTCLYTEAYVLRRAENTINDPDTRDRVVLGLNYYFGVVEIPDDDVVLALTGLPVNQVLEAITSDVGETLTNLTASPEANQLISIAVSQEATDAIQGAANLIQPIANTAEDLTDITLRSNIQPIYFSLKEYLCCELNDASYDIWIAWLVAGILGFIVSILCSIIVVIDTMRSPAHYARKNKKSGGGNDGQLYQDAEAEHVEVQVRPVSNR